MEKIEKKRTKIRLYESPQIPTIELPELPVGEWRESKFVLYDETKRTVAHVLTCDGCGKQITVSPTEYEKFDATLCGACAKQGI